TARTPVAPASWSGQRAESHRAARWRKLPISAVSLRAKLAHNLLVKTETFSIDRWFNYCAYEKIKFNRCGARALAWGRCSPCGCYRHARLDENFQRNRSSRRHAPNPEVNDWARLWGPGKCKLARQGVGPKLRHNRREV